MRLTCETVIVYRLLLNHSHSGRCKKATFTALTLYRKPKPMPVTYLLLCTAKNPRGTRYKVDGNIQEIFTNFVDAGKASIRIKNPEHDVVISKAEPAELRQFICSLRKVLRGGSLDQCMFSEPPSKVTRTLETLVVHGQEHYPLQGFPSALKNLAIEGCNLVQLGRDLLALENLSILSLKGTKLQTLPTELNNLPLRRLTASENCIVELQPDLFENRLRSCLESLDVSNNQLAVLPETLCRVRKLIALAAGNNHLHKLPDGIGYLCHLRSLDLTSNALTLLPASLLKLKLDWISVWNNPLKADGGWPLVDTAPSGQDQVPWPLIELAARAVVAATGVELTAEDVPRSLLQFLHTATPCYGCQQPVFSSTAASVILRVDLRRTVMPGGQLVWAPSHDSLVPVQALICSSRCLPH